MGKVMLRIFLLVSLMLVLVGCGENASVERVVNENDNLEANNSEIVETDDSEHEDESSEDEAEAEEEIGTRENPLSIGERVSIQYYDIFHGDVKLDIELLELIHGDEALQMVREGNEFNDEPDEGQEYILAKFYVKVNEVEDEPFDLNHAQFNAVSTDGNTYDEFVVVAGLEPDLQNELYEGAEREGFTYFLVDKDDEAPLAVFNRGSDAEVWFQLR